MKNPWLFFFAALLSMTAPRIDRAQSQVTTIILGHSGGAGLVSDLRRVIERDRIWEKYGLNVKAVYFNSGSVLTQAMAGGNIVVSDSDVPAMLNLSISGVADVKLVAVTINHLEHIVVVRKNVMKPEDLKGKRLAVSGFGSLGDFLERYIIRKYGMEPGRDVVMLSVGTQPERIQALMSGAVDAADLSFPADVQAERKGFKVLWDAKQEVSYPSMSVVMRRKSVTDDRDTVMRMVKAHVEAIHYLKANKDFSMKVLGKYLKTNDRELLEGSYEIYRKDFIPVPYPITQGLQPTYEYVALQRPDVWNHKLEEFMDPSFIAELEKTGFIAGLSKSGR